MREHPEEPPVGAPHTSLTSAGRYASAQATPLPGLLQARLKVREQGWSNVTVVEADACQWAPPEGCATLVTFSYSLSSERGAGQGLLALHAAPAALTRTGHSFHGLQQPSAGAQLLLHITARLWLVLSLG